MSLESVVSQYRRFTSQNHQAATYRDGVIAAAIARGSVIRDHKGQPLAVSVRLDVARRLFDLGESVQACPRLALELHNQAAWATRARGSFDRYLEGQRAAYGAILSYYIKAVKP